MKRSTAHSVIKNGRALIRRVGGGGLSVVMAWMPFNSFCLFVYLPGLENPNFNWVVRLFF